MARDPTDQPSGFGRLAWAIDPQETCRAKRWRNSFDLAGSFATPYFEPGTNGLAWGIVSVGHAGDEVKGIRHSSRYNPILVGYIHKIQAIHLAEIQDSGISDTRRMAIRSVQTFMSIGLEAAGPSLLNCSTDASGSMLILDGLQVSVLSLESGQSLPEWEIVSLFQTLKTACSDASGTDLPAKAA